MMVKIQSPFSFKISSSDDILSNIQVQNTHPFQQQLPHHDNVDPPEWLKRRTEADPFVHDNVRPFVTFGTKALPKRHWR